MLDEASQTQEDHYCVPAFKSLDPQRQEAEWQLGGGGKSDLLHNNVNTLDMAQVHHLKW